MPEWSIKGWLGLDGQPFQRTLAQSEKQAAGFKGRTESMFASMGSKFAAAFSVGAVISMARSLREYVDNVKDMADATGLSVKSVQELDYAFKSAGGSAGDLAALFKELSDTRQRAINGDQKALDQLKKYKLGYADIKTLSPDEFFNRIAKAVSEIADPMERNAAAVEAFGKAAKTLLPILTDLEKLRQQANDVGAVSSTDKINELDQYSKEIDKLTGKWNALKVSVGVPAARFLNESLEQYKSDLEDFRKTGFVTIRGPWDVARIAGNAMSGNKGLSQDDIVSKETRDSIKKAMEDAENEQTAMEYIKYINDQKFFTDVKEAAKDEALKTSVESGFKITSPSAANSLQRSGLFGSVSSLAGGGSPSALLREIVRNTSATAKFLRSIDNRKEFVWPT